MAEVYLARQRGPMQFEKLVVVKTVHPRLASRPELASLLLEEARIAALVKHPNVVDIYDLGEAEGTYFIAMEYLEGEALGHVLKQSRLGARLDPFSTARIVADCAAGLHAAHELRSLAGEPLELVHQDVTPGNVIILYTGQVKLVDFGVARVRTTADDGTVKGKTGYLAPEMLDRSAPTRPDRRTDLWSLGVVLWEALTLRRLFYSADETQTVDRIRTQEIVAPSRLNPAVPRDLDEVCLGALQRDPARRYATAHAMQVDLEQILRQASWTNNEPIARFLRTAFADRITARRELLKELATSRGPRNRTLDRLAAIRDDSDDASPAAGTHTIMGAHGTGVVAAPGPARRRGVIAAATVGLLGIGVVVAPAAGGDEAAAPSAVATVAPDATVAVRPVAIDAGPAAPAPPDAAPPDAAPAPPVVDAAVRGHDERPCPPPTAPSDDAVHREVALHRRTQEVRRRRRRRRAAAVRRGAAPRRSLRAGLARPGDGPRAAR